jgi:hypothetical protein
MACATPCVILLYAVPQCPQDSDHLWRLSPPARSALRVVLSEPAAALRISWSVTRTAPLASAKGGPECAADVTLTLAGESREQLLEVGVTLCCAVLRLLELCYSACYSSMPPCFCRQLYTWCFPGWLSKMVG